MSYLLAVELQMFQKPHDGTQLKRILTCTKTAVHAFLKPNQKVFSWIIKYLKLNFLSELFAIFWIVKYSISLPAEVGKSKMNKNE